MKNISNLHNVCCEGDESCSYGRSWTSYRKTEPVPEQVGVAEVQHPGDALHCPGQQACLPVAGQAWSEEQDYKYVTW